MEDSPKILAIQFKYFGDAVMMIPALQTIRHRFPNGILHVLVPEEIAPLFRHLPYLNRVWAMPRHRGRARFGQTWPIIRALRRERFDRSVDFAGNDRGAILSRLAGARRRLGWNDGGGFLGRKFCYTDRVVPEKKLQHESARLGQLLSAWQIPAPLALEVEIRSDPALADAAEKLLPLGTILCHIASSQPKKEWPLRDWAELYCRAAATGWRVAFTTAVGEREQAQMSELKKILPDAPLLPVIADLPLFLAVLNRAKVFVAGDTGPLHFAAGLGVPTISLFGPTSAVRWAPPGQRHQVLTGSPCSCDGNSAVCHSASHCLAAITPDRVFERLKTILTSASTAFG